MRKFIALIITGGALIVGAPAVASIGVGGASTVDAHQIPSAISIQRANEPVQVVVFKGAVTAANGVNQNGRRVALFADDGRFLGFNVTGSTPGHSPGYWEVYVRNQPNEWMAGITGHHFNAYVQDQFNSPWVDYLPAQSPNIGWALGSPGTASAATVRQVPSTITIKHAPVDYFVGGVYAANGVPQAGRRVYLFSTYNRYLGSTVTGTTRGHSAAYWQIRVTGWAGISLHHFDAYAQDAFTQWNDYLPAQSPIIGY